MKPEEIKIGGVYDVRVKVIKKIPGNTPGKIEIGAYTVDRDTNSPMEYETSWFLTEETPAFAEITPENGTKNSEPAPKYDPCRLLRRGDRVQVKRRNGRSNGKHGEYLREAYCLVAEDEERNELVRVFHNSSEYLLDPAYLELVTPVEELEPYYVEEEGHSWCIRKPGPSDIYSTLAWFSKKRHPHAKAAAEAECARLNAEYRKETEQ